MITFEQYQQTKSIALRNQLVQRNLNLVYKVAHRFSKATGVELDDLIQEGSLGLCRAVEQFNPSTGYKFSSYAMPHIRGAMLHYVRDKVRPIRIPRPYHDLVSKSRKIDASSSSEMAEALGVSVAEWTEAKAAHRPIKSIEAKLYTNSDCTIMDTVAVGSDPYDSIYVDDLLSELPAHQGEVFRAIYFSQMNQKEAAQYLGVTPVTVRRNLKKGMQRLKNLAA
jgi:RNA polymerase sigma-B factor